MASWKSITAEEDQAAAQPWPCDGDTAQTSDSTPDHPRSGCPNFCYASDTPPGQTGSYPLLIVASMVVGALAATLLFAFGMNARPHTDLGELTFHLLYAGLLMSVVTVVAIAGCSHVASLTGPDVHHHPLVIWLPVGTLTVTTTVVVLAAELWYIIHRTHTWTAPLTMALVFVAIALVALIPLCLTDGVLSTDRPVPRSPEHGVVTHPQEECFRGCLGRDTAVG